MKPFGPEHNPNYTSCSQKQHLYRAAMLIVIIGLVIGVLFAANSHTSKTYNPADPNRKLNVTWPKRNPLDGPPPPPSAPAPPAPSGTYERYDGPHISDTRFMATSGVSFFVPKEYEVYQEDREKNFISFFPAGVEDPTHADLIATILPMQEGWKQLAHRELLDTIAQYIAEEEYDYPYDDMTRVGLHDTGLEMKANQMYGNHFYIYNKEYEQIVWFQVLEDDTFFSSAEFKELLADVQYEEPPIPEKPPYNTSLYVTASRATKDNGKGLVGTPVVLMSWSARDPKTQTVGYVNLVSGKRYTSDTYEDITFVSETVGIVSGVYTKDDDTSFLLYATAESSSDFVSSLRSLELSPQGHFVSFNEGLYESRRWHLYNVHTGEDVLEHFSLVYDIDVHVVREIVYNDRGQMAFVTDNDDYGYGVPGISGLFTVDPHSDSYNKYFDENSIWALQLFGKISKEEAYKLSFRDLSYLNDEMVQFSVYEKEPSGSPSLLGIYTYDLSKDDLQKVE